MCPRSVCAAVLGCSAPAAATSPHLTYFLFWAAAADSAQLLQPPAAGASDSDQAPGHPGHPGDPGEHVRPAGRLPTVQVGGRGRGRRSCHTALSISTCPCQAEPRVIVAVCEEPSLAIRGPSNVSPMCNVSCSARIRAANDPWVFTITEKAPTRAVSWLKVPTSSFTFKTLCILNGH